MEERKSDSQSEQDISETEDTGIEEKNGLEKGLFFVGKDGTMKRDKIGKRKAIRTRIQNIASLLFTPLSTKNLTSFMEICKFF